MTLRNQLIILTVAIAVAFAFGRYTVSKPSTSDTSIAKTDTKEDTSKNTHAVITTTKAPDGTTKVVETIDTVSQTQINKDTAIKTLDVVTQPKTGKINISALVGNDLSKPGITPLYGVSFQKEFIGPITVGAFGLTKGVVGLSLGINF